jgi:hypothetical protein
VLSSASWGIGAADWRPLADQSWDHLTHGAYREGWPRHFPYGGEIIRDDEFLVVPLSDAERLRTELRGANDLLRKKEAEAERLRTLLEIAERFWPKVDRQGKDECWLWRGATKRRDYPYGMFWMGEGNRPAAQVAWELRHGEDFPEGMQACHSCDNPRCCNPAHIFVGSMSDKHQGRRSKGPGRSRAGLDRFKGGSQWLNHRSLSGRMESRCRKWEHLDDLVRAALDREGEGRCPNCGDTNRDNREFPIVAPCSDPWHTLDREGGE